MIRNLEASGNKTSQWGHNRSYKANAIKLENFIHKKYLEFLDSQFIDQENNN